MDDESDRRIKKELEVLNLSDRAIKYAVDHISNILEHKEEPEWPSYRDEARNLDYKAWERIIGIHIEAKDVRLGEEYIDEAKTFLPYTFKASGRQGWYRVTEEGQNLEEVSLPTCGKCKYCVLKHLKQSCVNIQKVEHGRYTKYIRLSWNSDASFTFRYSKTYDRHSDTAPDGTVNLKLIHCWNVKWNLPHKRSKLSVTDLNVKKILRRGMFDLLYTMFPEIFKQFFMEEETEERLSSDDEDDDSTSSASDEDSC